MRDRTISKLISHLNSGKIREGIFLRPLSDTVVFAKVWKKITPADSPVTPDGPDKFYFIKSSDLFVAAVFDMGSDLHWYVIPKFRGKGYLSIALSSVILPHILQEKESQRITIDGEFLGTKMSKASEQVALKAGFKKISEADGTCEYILPAEKFIEREYIDGFNTKMTNERMTNLCKRVNYLSRSLWQIENEMEMLLGDSNYAEELSELRAELNRHILRIEDKWYENKQHQ